MNLFVFAKIFAKNLYPSSGWLCWHWCQCCHWLRWHHVSLVNNFAVTVIDNYADMCQHSQQVRGHLVSLVKDYTDTQEITFLKVKTNKKSDKKIIWYFLKIGCPRSCWPRWDCVSVVDYYVDSGHVSAWSMTTWTKCRCSQWLREHGVGVCSQRLCRRGVGVVNDYVDTVSV